MSAHLTVNPRLDESVRSSPEMRAALHELATKIATAAQSIGHEVSRTYHTQVTEEDGKVRVQADTNPLNAASWIEFGTQTLPARAPLRTAAEQAGLQVHEPHG